MEFIVYGGLVFAFLGAFVIGRMLDKQHSTSTTKWKTGAIGRKTVFQSVVLGVIAGPILYFCKGGSEALWFCMLCMAAAPFIVDLLKPTVVRTA